MKVQLISVAAVHMLRTKVQLVSGKRGWQQFHNSLEVEKFFLKLEGHAGR